MGIYKYFKFIIQSSQDAFETSKRPFIRALPIFTAAPLLVSADLDSLSTCSLNPANIYFSKSNLKH